ncbi:MAG: DUF3047 domain-containing protein [Candidatus Sericytochromatia bacterium]|nr:DUF3047 domain-containing protein [Candidatus Sericytochromatia bacterium]
MDRRLNLVPWRPPATPRIVLASGLATYVVAACAAAPALPGPPEGPPTASGPPIGLPGVLPTPPTPPPGGRLVGDFSAAGWRSWENVTYFPWSPKNDYRRLDTPDGPLIHVVSQDAASMLVRRVEIDLTKEPIATWRWRIAAPIAGGDERKRETDDCAARVYFVWGLKDRKDIFSAKGLAYVWGQTRRVGDIGGSPFTDQIAVMALRSGSAGAGAWQTERRDLEADYRAYFKAPPPGPITAIALLTDTDHTASQASAWYAPIRVLARP